MRNVADKSCRGDQNTHFVFSNFFFFQKRAVYEIMVEKYCRVGQALNTLDNYWYTHTHPSQYVILTAFPPQQRFQECASVLRYTYIACPVHFVSCGVLIMTVMNTAIQDVTLYVVVVQSFKILVDFYQTTHCHILEHVKHQLCLSKCKRTYRMYGPYSICRAYCYSSCVNNTLCQYHVIYVTTDYLLVPSSLYLK